LLQVTVPKTSKGIEFTKFINTKAIYAMTVTDEETALAIAETLNIQPISEYGIAQLLEANPELAGRITGMMTNQLGEGDDAGIFDDEEQDDDNDDF
jgi:hypothetical protein